MTYCKAQLVELERLKPQFIAQGRGVCSISYDSVEVLAHFAARKGITLPMLSDPGSAIIRRFRVLTDTVAETDMRQNGMAHPGTFVIDERGIIRHKYFEEHYIHRVTMRAILADAFDAAPNERPAKIRANPVAISTASTDAQVRPGNRFTLVVEVTPAPGVHLYAPGAERYGYHPLALTVEPPPHATVYPPRFPKAEIMEFPFLGESVPVDAV